MGLCQADGMNSIKKPPDFVDRGAGRQAQKWLQVSGSYPLFCGLETGLGGGAEFLGAGLDLLAGVGLLVAGLPPAGAGLPAVGLLLVAILKYASLELQFGLF